MFQPFSGGYLLGRLYVEPTGEENAVMQTDQHEQAADQVYDEDDQPLVMKLDSVHVTVHADDRVPAGTLGLPRSVLEETRVRNPPALREVLLAKAGHAGRFLP
jgi:hypothetical protein